MRAVPKTCEQPGCLRPATRRVRRPIGHRIIEELLCWEHGAERERTGRIGGFAVQAEDWAP